MRDLRAATSYRWNAEGQQHELHLVWVPGTGGEPYFFGRAPNQKPVHVGGFYVGATPVTQALWTDDLSAVPADGRPYLGTGDERRLRGGCHHNWDLHCRVFWRYGIDADAHDGCIWFRLVLASPCAAA
jgi:formylglycine-generating enzyme required for sulfatase activity